MFALRGIGVSQGAIVNQNQSVNSSANPANKGSIVSLFATGAGQTIPPGVDGKPASAPLPTPVAPVSVKIGGLDAEVLYAGAAPTLVSGVLQVNVRVPAGAPSGNVPVVITMGATISQAGVTFALLSSWAGTPTYRFPFRS